MIDVLFYGVLSGAIFAMVSFGFSLVLGVLGIVNMVHGVYVVMGGIFAHALATQAGVPVPLAIALAAATTGVFAVAIHKLFVERVFTTNPLMVLVQTFGIAIVATKLMEKSFGASERLLRVDVPGYPIAELGPVIVPTIELVVFGIAILSTLVLVLLLNFTDFGRSVRACRDNARNAAILGINVSGVHARTMLVCGVWAGLAGALLVGSKPVAPYMQMQWAVDAFLIVIIGGLGSIPGVLLGAFFYGVLNYMAFYYFPVVAPALVFGTLIALLLLRPQGIFGLGTVARK